MKTLFGAVFIAACLAGGSAAAADSDSGKLDLEKATADRLAVFEYPGANRFEQHNQGTICQFVLASPDELSKVDDWYRRELSIDKAEGNGVADAPWPATGKVSGTRGQQQQSVFQDGIRPGNAGSTESGLRPISTHTVVVKNSDYTLVVTLNRLATDKQTLISLVYLPNTAE
jgi:hypothetical protein